MRLAPVCFLLTLLLGACTEGSDPGKDTDPVDTDDTTPGETDDTTPGETDDTTPGDTDDTMPGDTEVAGDPEAVDDAYALTGTELVVDAASGLRANDDLAGGDPAVTAFTTSAGGATIAVAADGSFVYTAVDGFLGDDTFDYDLGGVSQATVTVSVGGALDDTYATLGTDLTVDAAGGVLANDRGNGTIQLVAGTLATDEGGSVELAGDGSFVYSGPSGVAADGFTYDWTDDAGQATGRVDISLSGPSDDAYIAFGQLTVDAAGGVLANDNLGPTVTVTGYDSTSTSGGSVSVDADGAFTFTPSDDFEGDDTFSYTVSDGASSATATVTVSVGLLYDDAYDAFGGGLSVSAGEGLLANDGLSALSGATLTAQVGAATSQGGSLDLSADGSFDYTPAADFSGVDTFEYEVVASGVAGTATLRLDVGRAVDDSYRVLGASRTISAAEGVLANDIDPTGTLAAIAFDGATGSGTLSLGADGGLTYTVGASPGDDTYTYTASTDVGDDEATISFTVESLFDDSYALLVGQDGETLAVGASSGVLSNDDPTDATVISHTSPSLGGTADVSGDGSFTYAPPPSATGLSTFDYTAETADGQTSSATVTVDVGLLGADAYDVSSGSLSEGAPGLLANDVLVGSGATLTASATTAGGTVTLSDDGSFTYTAPGGSETVDSFVYTVTTSAGSASQTVTLSLLGEVEGVDDAYVVFDDTVLFTGDDNLLANDVGGGLAAVAESVDTDLGGVAVISSNGDLEYTRPDGVTEGSDTFSYQLVGGSAPVAVTVELGSLGPDIYRAFDNEVSVFTAAEGVSRNDVGFADLALVPGSLETAEGGEVELQADGSFTYDPPFFFVGEDSFTYEVTTGGASYSTTVYLDVGPFPPVIEPLPPGELVRGSLVVTDPAEGLLGGVYPGFYATPGTITSARGGTVEVEEDGTFVYTPPLDNGEVSPGFDNFFVTVTAGGVPGGGLGFLLVAGCVDDLAVIWEDTASATAGLLENDFLGAGATVSGITASPGPGTLGVTAQGGFNFVRAPDTAGPEVWTVGVTDGAYAYECDFVLDVASGVSDSYTLLGDDLDVVAPGVLANDVLPASGAGLDLTTGAFTALNGVYSVLTDGRLIYASDGCCGPDVFSYTLTASDAGVFASPPSVEVEIRVDRSALTDDTYEALGQALVVPGDEGVLANDGLPDAAVVVAETIATDRGGSVTIEADGGFSYEPPVGQLLPDTFPYTVQIDGTQDTAEVTILNAYPVDDAYLVLDDVLVVDGPDGVLTNDVLSVSDKVVLSTDDSATDGVILVDADGGFTYERPASGFDEGVTSFAYEVSATGVSRSAEVTLVLFRIPQQTYDVGPLDTHAIDAAEGILAGGLTLPEGASLIAETVTSDLGATVDIAADGSFVYTLATNTSGADAFDYHVAFGAQVAPGEVVVNVWKTEDDAYSWLEDGPIMSVPVDRGLLANDDVGSFIVSSSSYTTEEGGTLELAGDGSFTYQPLAGFGGVDTFTYEVVLTDATLTSVVSFDLSQGKALFVDPAVGVSGQLAGADSGDWYILPDGAGTLSNVSIQLLEGQVVTGGAVMWDDGPTWDPTSIGTTLSGAGPVLSLADDVLVQGVQIANVPGTAIYGDGADRVTLDRLSLTDVASGGGSHGIEVRNAVDLAILGSTLEGVGSATDGAGIYLKSVSGSIDIKDNTITDAIGGGIVGEQDSGGALDLYIAQNTLSGVADPASAALSWTVDSPVDAAAVGAITMLENEIVGFDGTGIRVIGTETHGQASSEILGDIRSNSITSVGASCMEFSTDGTGRWDLDARENICTDIPLHGIVLGNGVQSISEIFIIGNDLYDTPNGTVAGQAGILATGGGYLYARANEVFSAQGVGIEAHGVTELDDWTNLFIERNVVVDAAEDGVLYQGPAMSMGAANYVLLNRNEVFNVLGYAIHVMAQQDTTAGVLSDVSTDLALTENLASGTGTAGTIRFDFDTAAPTTGAQHPWCVQTSINTASTLEWVGGAYEQVSLEGTTDATSSLQTPNPDVDTVTVSGDAPTLVPVDTCLEPPVPALP